MAVDGAKNRSTNRRSMLGLLASAAVISVVPSTPALAQVELTTALRQGGHVIVFRHGATNSKQADTDPLNHDNVKKQRLLTDAGKALAREIGSVMRQLAIPVSEVHTSKFNRAIETAKLMNVGKVATTLDLTEGGLVVPPDENVRRAKAFRDLVGKPIAAKSNRVIVSHKPNIIDAFGKDWFEVKEGEAAIFKVEADGKYSLVTRLQATQWAILEKPLR